jgi:hypothetical protein
MRMVLPVLEDRAEAAYHRQQRSTNWVVLAVGMRSWGVGREREERRRLWVGVVGQALEKRRVREERLK